MIIESESVLYLDVKFSSGEKMKRTSLCNFVLLRCRYQHIATAITMSTKALVPIPVHITHYSGWTISLKESKCGAIQLRCYNENIA